MQTLPFTFKPALTLFFNFICKLFFLFLLVSIPFISSSQVYVKQNAAGSNDGTSWANAFMNLQSALDAASPGDQVWMAAGNYFPEGPTPENSHFIITKSLFLYGGFSGNESNLSERNPELYQVIFNGDLNADDEPDDNINFKVDNAHHVLIVDAAGTEVVLDGLIFKGGTTRTDTYSPTSSDLSGYNRWMGGALYIKNTSTTIRSCVFLENSGARGSALNARDSDFLSNQLIIENCRFENNYSYQYGNVRIADWANAKIISSTFRLNDSNIAGGLFLHNTHALVENCEFDRNVSTTSAGGCFIWHDVDSHFPSTSTQVRNSRFLNNQSSSNGGGLRVNNSVEEFYLVVDSCLFSGNISGFAGGGISLDDYADLDLSETACKVVIHNSVFDNNRGRFGGGAYLGGSDDSLHIEITNCLFDSNVSPNGSAGGLYLGQYDNGKVSASIRKTILENNSANRLAGGLFIEGTENTDSLRYSIDSCTFQNNFSALWGGAICSTLFGSNAGPKGVIQHTSFNANESTYGGGAINSYSESLKIENCVFSGNYTPGLLSPEFSGGGAVLIEQSRNAAIINSIFENNRSDVDGSAIFNIGRKTVYFENILFANNPGSSTFFNAGNVKLLNTTFINNEAGLYAIDTSITLAQNSIFKNQFDNLILSGTPLFFSKGGNISHDATMESVLIGFGSHDDFNTMDPQLGADYYPLPASPCIDAGNPDGISSPDDLAGNPRIQGLGIDMGSFETLTVSAKDQQSSTSALPVYPNPAKGTIHFGIEALNEGPAEIQIHDELGRQVYTDLIYYKNDPTTFSIGLENLTPGMYSLSVLSNHQKKIAKFIKQ